jgi:cytochrome c-type biogenesis protein CcmH/NrfF
VLGGLGGLGLARASSVSAQSSGPAHLGYDPNAAVGGHYHEGLLGDQLLVIERSLKCNCSCGLDVHSCQFQMQCDVSPVWSERIRRDLAAGMTPEAIEASFVADFGTQVLMAPPPEGFNLVGYFLPATVIIAAGALIGLVARGGMKREKFAPVGEIADEDAERLRTEMQKFDEAESPDW